MTNRPWLVIAVLIGTALSFLSTTAYAQGIDLGKREYLNSCAVCHGTNGKGDGPLAVYLKKPVADLTSVQKSNAGVFPFNRIYDVIDGRQAVAAHGSRDMPVWGNVYSAEGGRLAFEFGVKREELESFVRGRVLSLIGYIYTLQSK